MFFCRAGGSCRGYMPFKMTVSTHCDAPVCIAPHFVGHLGRELDPPRSSSHIHVRSPSGKPLHVAVILVESKVHGGLTVVTQEEDAMVQQKLTTPEESSIAREDLLS